MDIAALSVSDKKYLKDNYKVDINFETNRFYAAPILLTADKLTEKYLAEQMDKLSGASMAFPIPGMNDLIYTIDYVDKVDNAYKQLKILVKNGSKKLLPKSDIYTALQGLISLNRQNNRVKA